MYHTASCIYPKHIRKEHKSIVAKCLFKTYVISVSMIGIHHTASCTQSEHITEEHDCVSKSFWITGLHCSLPAKPGLLSVGVG